MDAERPDIAARGEQASQSDANQRLREYWDQDSATYNQWPEHGAESSVERASWLYELSRLLPQPAASVLDVGSGTGFLALMAARLGHRVTAMDISSQMLAELERSAAREGLEIETVCAPAEQPPERKFDVVTERLVLWTLPDPGGALRAWREVIEPDGRLLTFEGVWTGGGYGEAIRRRGRKLLQARANAQPEHHAPYPNELVSSLPLLKDPTPDRFISEIEAAGWCGCRVSRLRDIEWARVVGRPRLEQLLGATPEYVITAFPDERPRRVRQPVLGAGG